MEKTTLSNDAAFWPEGLCSYSEKSITQKVITRKTGGDIVLLAFQQGQELKEHTAPVDAIVHILEGKSLITIAGKEHWLVKGQMIILPANIPHAVAAREGHFKMLLTKIKN